MTRAIQSEYYGENTRWFIGIVEEIADPLRLGRVKVRAYGVHNHDTSEIPTHALPWATVAIPTTEAGIDGVGVNPGLMRGSQVFGIFSDGDQCQYPIVLAVIPFIESETPITNPSLSRIPTSADDVDLRGAVGNNNTERTFNFFLSYQSGKYFTAESAAAIAGVLLYYNFKFDTTKSNRLSIFSAEKNLDPALLNTKLQFILSELQKYPNQNGLAELKRSSDITHSVRIFSNRYLGKNDKLSTKAQYALDIYNQYFLNSEIR